jgi:hypothetical protein
MAYKKAKVWTKEAILADWQKALKKGLGRKQLDPAVVSTFTPLLLAKIQARIDEGGDYNKEGNNTRAVATALGNICKILADGSTITLGLFQASFKLCKLHPKCPGGQGSGRWCDV